VGPGRELCQFLVLDAGPQPVGARQQDITWTQGSLAGDSHIRNRRVASYAAFHEIAHRMVLRLLLGDCPFLDQDFDMTVIPGSGEHLPLPHLVDAAVADVPPERPVLLDQADSAGRAWA